MTISTTSKKWLSGAALSVFIAPFFMSGTQAFASAFGLHEFSTSGIAQSFAGAAAGDAGLNSMFWNPAIVTDFAGWQSSYSVSGIFVDSKLKTQAGTYPKLGVLGNTNIGTDNAVPASSNSIQVDDHIWLSLGVNAPYGLITKADNPSASSLYGRTSRVYSTSFNPSIAYKFTDWLSVGVGLQVLYFDTRLTSSLPGVISSALKGDDWGVGATAGFTIKPREGTEFGFGYRSQVSETLNGNMAVITPTASLVQAVKAPMTLPNEIMASIKQRIDDKLTVSATYEFTEWSTLKRVPVYAKSGSPYSGLQVSQLGFDYKDSWMVSLGGSYRFLPDWTARLGVAYEDSPITDTSRSVRLPDSNRIWASTGLSYQFNEKLSFDVAYAHIFSQKAKIHIVDPTHPAFIAQIPAPYVGKADSQVDIASIGLNYRWDDPKQPEPAILVRKN